MGVVPGRLIGVVVRKDGGGFCCRRTGCSCVCVCEEGGVQSDTDRNVDVNSGDVGETETENQKEKGRDRESEGRQLMNPGILYRLACPVPIGPPSPSTSHAACCAPSQQTMSFVHPSADREIATAFVLLHAQSCGACVNVPRRLWPVWPGSSNEPVSTTNSSPLAVVLSLQLERVDFLKEERMESMQRETLRPISVPPICTSSNIFQYRAVSNRACVSVVSSFFLLLSHLLVCPPAL